MSNDFEKEEKIQNDDIRIPMWRLAIASCLRFILRLVCAFCRLLHTSLSAFRLR